MAHAIFFMGGTKGSVVRQKIRGSYDCIAPVSNTGFYIEQHSKFLNAVRALPLLSLRGLRDDINYFNVLCSRERLTVFRNPS